jgi:hypothetical protein
VIVKRPTDIDPKSEEFQDLLSKKADLSQIKTILDIKTNKIDTEATMRSIDIMHKQITHMIVLLIEHVKTSLTQ